MSQQRVQKRLKNQQMSSKLSANPHGKGLLWPKDQSRAVGLSYFMTLYYFATLLEVCYLTLNR